MIIKNLLPKANAETKKKGENKFTTIAELEPLEIGDTSELHFTASLDEEGVVRIDVRTYIDTPKYTGATKKGINFTEEHLSKVIKNLQELKASISKGKLKAK